MAKRGVWLTYDLGVGGDYQGLYAWLDNHMAIECGNNLAFFKYEWDIAEDAQSIERLLQDLSDNVELVPGNRLYLIRPKYKKDKEITAGSFIYGRRKASPWEGFGSRSSDETEEV